MNLHRTTLHLALVVLLLAGGSALAQVNDPDLSVPAVGSPSGPMGAPLTCGAPVLIDFETLPDTTPIPSGTRITTQFAPVGVSMFATDDPAGPQIFQFGLTGQSGVNALGPRPSFQTSGLDISFSATVWEASILALDVGAGGLGLEAFDAANNPLAMDSVTNLGLGIGEADTLSVSGGGTPIARLEIRRLVAPGGDGYLIDDLQFCDVAPAPLTPRAGLLALAVLLLIAGAATLRRISVRARP